jgi:hypothetical protein
LATGACTAAYTYTTTEGAAAIGALWGGILGAGLALAGYKKNDAKSCGDIDDNSSLGFYICQDCIDNKEKRQNFLGQYDTCQLLNKNSSKGNSQSRKNNNRKKIKQ